MSRQEQNDRHIIWSDISLDLDDWRESLEELYPGYSDDELYDIMVKSNAENLYDERVNLNIQLSQPIIEMAENKKQFEIPLYEKPFLSIEEASVYTGIGRDKLYELTNPEDCPFVLWIGNRRMIKRRVFDEYIEKCYSI